MRQWSYSSSQIGLIPLISCDTDSKPVSISGVGSKRINAARHYTERCRAYAGTRNGFFVLNIAESYALARLPAAFKSCDHSGSGHYSLSFNAMTLIVAILIEKLSTLGRTTQS